MAITHLGRIAKPPHDFTGRELQKIRLGLGLPVEEVARLANLEPHQVIYVEDPRDGFDAQGRNGLSLGAHWRITMELHRHIMARGKSAPDREHRRRGRKPKEMALA